jgi:hypothetical protein
MGRVNSSCEVVRTWIALENGRGVSLLATRPCCRNKPGYRHSLSAPKAMGRETER